MMKVNEVVADVLWKIFKPAVFALAALPLVFLAVDIVNQRLGANPVETVTHFTGDWALRLLLVTLAITPLRRLTGWSRLLRVRRMLGLYTFFYTCLHFVIWLVLDHFFDPTSIVEDIIKRPYITIGFTAFVLLIPLAATSTDAMIRRLGGRWRKLHRLVYAIAALGVLHYLWLVKADWREPAVYALILGVLLIARLPSVSAWLDARRKPARADIPTA